MPALAPEPRPEEPLKVAGAVDDPVGGVELDDEPDVCVGIPVVGKVRGVDVGEEVDFETDVVLAGISEAWKLSWYSGANRT